MGDSESRSDAVIIDRWGERLYANLVLSTPSDFEQAAFLAIRLRMDNKFAGNVCEFNDGHAIMMELNGVEEIRDFMEAMSGLLAKYRLMHGSK